mmetsp:Transcript_15043/g.46953  ORF Transcript_15043/g.46953 Transcript_15043/m.46953 type:complete len:145 (+) Transcript_15043:972-1406(+)
MWSQRSNWLLVSVMHCRKLRVSTPHSRPPDAAEPAATAAAGAATGAADEPPPPNIMWPMAEPIIEPAADEAIVPIMLGPAEAAAGGSALWAATGGGAGFGANAEGAAGDAMDVAGRGGAAMVDAPRDGADELFLERAKPILGSS